MVLEGSEGILRFGFGGKLWNTKRFLFGREYSPVICRELLQSLVGTLTPPPSKCCSFIIWIVCDCLLGIGVF